MKDPRLHLAAVIISLQILGQTVLRFDLSIAQILVSLSTCALLELSIVFWQKRVIAWPGSALLTGNGVAFILRVPGTQHGDWWSLRGAQLYAVIAAVSLLSKYAIRVNSRHVFNPSNVGLVLGFLILGSSTVDPQDLWWGPLSPAIALTLAVIAAGGVLVTRRQGLLPIAISFLITFAFGIGVLAASNHAVSARWHVGPVSGWSFWWVLLSSPEVLVFLLFMITDPKTIPAGRAARVAHGASVAVAATLFLAPQTTEFATKVAILAGLMVVCLARPLVERAFPESAGSVTARRRRLVGIPAGCAIFAMAILALGTLSRHPSAQVPTALTVRPHVSLPKGSVPELSIGASARRIEPAPDAATARRIARDLAEDLVIEARAITEGAPETLASVVTGDRLESTRSAIGTVEAEPLATTRYQLARGNIELYLDPSNPQAPPSFAVEVHGTVQRASAPAQPFRGIFVLVQVGDRFLLADAQPAR